MIKKIFRTDKGCIRYWCSEKIDKTKKTLVFLPGLTADHRLFDKQIEYFEGKYNILVWDAPMHAESRPFKDDFTLMDKAKWLDSILTLEEIEMPVIVGQSMGGYVGQSYAQIFPNKMAGFISIDSAPLARFYITTFEIWMMKVVEPIYRMYPWKALVRDGSKGCAVSEYGYNLMKEMMMVYEENPLEYSHIAGHGYKMLAGAYEANLPYEIKCPALLICGEKDVAGSTRKYNKKWHEKSGIPIQWIANAGHNSNTDQPEIINKLIDEFIREL